MYDLVVGIDFGSSGTGFAYSLFNKNSIILGQIYGSIVHKVPTEIILDDNNNILEFGAECVKFLKEKGLSTGNYFKGIKMELYNNKNTIIAENTGKEFPLTLVIQKVLEKIKEISINEISKNRPSLKQQTEKIKWVVTVPSIWEAKQKSIMMESCIGAGLVNENTDKSLFFALEPEAASLYCLINKEIDREYFKKGDYYIVCDLGGGTGDIVAHLVGSNNSLNEISPSCGGNFGSNEIDKCIFKDIIFKLFGCHDFNSFYLKYKKMNKDNNESDKIAKEKNKENKNKIKNENSNIEDNEKRDLYNEWSEIERQIKDFKEGITKEKIENNIKCTLNFSLFKEICEEDIDINDLVEEYNSNIYDEKLKLTVRNKKRWFVEFPYEIVYNYMKIQANSICKIINNINANEEIKTIIFVGGYCSNEILLELIKSDLNKITTYLQPSNPSLAVLEGAVLFGIQPSTINIRKAKYTIGKDYAAKWNDGLHSKKGEKYYLKDLNDWFCKDCFDKFIEVDQSLRYGEEFFHNSFMEGYCAIINFYKTKKKNPVFVFEDGITHIGKCKIQIDKEYATLKDRKIKVTMKFGGTYIDVTAIHLKSGKSAKTKLIFD